MVRKQSPAARKEAPCASLTSASSCSSSRNAHPRSIGSTTCPPSRLESSTRTPPRMSVRFVHTLPIQPATSSTRRFLRTSTRARQSNGLAPGNIPPPRIDLQDMQDRGCEPLELGRRHLFIAPRLCRDQPTKRFLHSPHTLANSVTAQPTTPRPTARSSLLLRRAR